MRLRGWLGRADQATKVRGMFIYPTHIAAILARHPDIYRARLVIDNPGGSDQMTLNAEVRGDHSSMSEAIEVSLREITKLRGEIAFHGPGELPNDGKLIEDLRKYV